MGPFGTGLSVTSLAASELEEQKLLAAARESFPAWDITPAFGGYMAVPKDATVIRAVDLDGLVKKIREQEQ